MEADLDLAFELADRAAELAMTHFARPIETTRKEDGSVVTAADHAVERMLRHGLALNRPSDAVLGEEFGLQGAGDRVWIIDPIDGTGFFADGDPNWRIHIVLQDAASITVAVVVAPALGLRWWAIRGGGAFESTWPGAATAQRRLAVSTRSEIATSIADAFPIASRSRLAPATIATPTPLPLVELLRGEIDAFLAEGFHIWDHAPWILLTEEAGGRFTDVEGGSSGAKGGGLYSNAAIHQALLEHLNYPDNP